MTFVVTAGQLATVRRSSSFGGGNSVRLTDNLTQDYATLWRTQPQIRTVTSFLGRNIAQIGAHIYERVSDVDRKRLNDHDAAKLLRRPNPRTTRYRMMDALVQDLGIYDNAILVKVKVDGSTRGLVRTPPAIVTPLGDSWMWPEGYRVHGPNGHKDFRPEEVIHLRGYNPVDSRWGVSPMETLRQILAEEHQAGVAREQLWRNGARFPGYIKRPPPKAGKGWSDEARRQFQADWNAAYTGQGSGVGGTPILEDDMEFHASGITPQDAQYLEGRKLTREEVAAAFHIPPPMIGILDHATFSNIKEQHKHLYQDTLGPWLTMIAEELNLQLLSDFEDADARNLYVEFNIAEKMRGSFEEQADSLQTSVGGPWITRNEARARQNLPQVDGGDELITPLNVIIGGQASPSDAEPKSINGVITKTGAAQVKATAPASDQSKAVKTLRKFFKRQQSAVLSALGADQDTGWWDGTRWNSELTQDLYAIAEQTSQKVAEAALADAELDPEGYDVGRTTKFLESLASQRAKMINATTKRAVDAALADDTEPADAFAAADGRAPLTAKTFMTALAGFATVEAGKQGSDGAAQKTWRVTNDNPRPSCAAVDGETVDVDAEFSNGALWPADITALDIADVAGCSCEVTISFESP